MSLELSELEFSNIGEWPSIAKAALIIVLCGALIGAAYYFHVQEQYKTLDRHRNTEVQLKKEFETKQAKAVQLDAYKKQMEEMKISFGAMLRQLPSKTEVEDLLVDISQTGLSSGIEFQLFKPEQERQIEFYAELPITIKMTGNYHQFGRFISGIAALPRIVTLHDIAISGDKGGSLTMDVKAKTYRYMDEAEIAAQRQAAKKAKKGKRRK